MCGINALVRLDGRSPDEASLQQMNAQIAHRGPDDQGVFVEQGVGLGHVRLSILDLSQKGHQPMVYEHKGKRVVMSYNGEVYNFQEMREELKAKGYAFSSGTDTEVLMASYLEWGPDCLQRWNGMFAFVLYDPQEQRLFGARDRFGQKPLKYFFDGQRFIASSELKAILSQDVSRVADLNAIDQFLTLQYVPAPRTGFRDIHKLPHAHFFVLDLNSGKLRLERYFELSYDHQLKLGQEEWMERLDEGLHQAVKRRMISDVPLGAFLSGGVDSSMVVAAMSQHTDQVKTFSIGFAEGDFDETVYARQVAKRYGTDHTEFRVDPDDLLEVVNDLIDHYEEPYADSSQLPTLFLSKMTRQHVTVALSGDAGDEHFGGYDKHRRHVLWRWLRWGMRPQRLYEFLLEALLWAKPTDDLEKLKIFVKTLTDPVGERHYNFTTYFDEFTKAEAYRESFRERLPKVSNPFEDVLQGKVMAVPDAIYYLDLNTYLPDDLNVKVDLASMKVSLEVRAPLLDHEFAQLAAQVPWPKKTGLRQGKKIFKQLAKRYLPHDLIYRKKQGFAVPIVHWFRGPLKGFIQERVLDESGIARQIFQEQYLERLLHEQLRGRDHAKKLWTLMALNRWYERYGVSLP